MKEETLQIRRSVLARFRERYSNELKTALSEQPLMIKNEEDKLQKEYQRHPAYACLVYLVEEGGMPGTQEPTVEEMAHIGSCEKCFNTISMIRDAYRKVDAELLLEIDVPGYCEGCNHPIMNTDLFCDFCGSKNSTLNLEAYNNKYLTSYPNKDSIQPNCDHARDIRVCVFDITELIAETPPELVDESLLDSIQLFCLECGRSIA